MALYERSIFARIAFDGVQECTIPARLAARHADVLRRLRHRDPEIAMAPPCAAVPELS